MTDTSRFLPIPLELLNAVIVLPPCSQYPSGLIWCKSIGGKSKAGKTAGTLQTGRYGRQDWRITYKNVNYKVSRVIYTKLFYNPGNLTVDHVDRDSTNNKVSNLRLANSHEQIINRKSKNNLKAKGVSWNNTRKKWCAQIKNKGKSKNLGRYECLKEAAEAYNTAALKLHPKEFVQLNNVSSLVCVCNKCKKKAPSV
jgi:hypothetical protein